MKSIRVCLCGLFVLGCLPVRADDKPAAPKPREALQPFNAVIGSWRGTGTKPNDRKDFWQETVAWEWRFKGDDVWINVAFFRGRYFDKGTLRFLPDKETYKLNLQTVDKKSLDFEGKLDKEKKILTLDRTDDKAKETQRIVVTMLHETRFLYDYEVRPDGRTGFSRQYRVGCTREGVAFASGDGKPECVVSGGLGTMKITYQGKDYYFCCTGCRDAFKDNPEKYIKEYEARKKGK